MDMLGLIKNSSLDDVERKLKNSFSAVREEMEDHLVAINENTDELKSHADFMNELDKKIESLQDRMDSLHLMLMKLMKSSLNENETKIVDVLDKNTSFMSCKDIAFSAGVSELFVKAHLFSMICKGVPLKEKVIEHQSYFTLERKNQTEQTVMLKTVC